MLAIEIRGNRYYTEQLTDENVRVVVDFADMDLVEGHHTVPVTVYVDTLGPATQVGVLGSDYRIVIALDRA